MRKPWLYGSLLLPFHSAFGQPPDSGVATSNGQLRVGVGLGYQVSPFPGGQSVLSLPIRMRSGVVLEPWLSFGKFGASGDFGAPSPTPDGFPPIAAVSEYGAGLSITLPLFRIGKFELAAVAAASATFTVADTGLQMATTNARLSLDAGLRGSYWLTERWALTAQITNPLVEYNLSKQTPLSGGFPAPPNSMRILPEAPTLRIGTTLFF
jgi:hypothetical protein